MRICMAGLVGLIALVALSEARAQEGFGVGIMVGEPTGLSMKKWISETKAIDAAAAWSFSENASFQFHADYLHHNFSLLKWDKAERRLSAYIGVGARLKFKEED